MRHLTSHRSSLSKSSSEGKGSLGCIATLLLLGLTLLVSVRVGPPYFAYKSFEADVKKETSRAGANAFDDETVIRNILDLAKRNEIRLPRENITVERYAGQIMISVHYVMPLDLLFYQRDINFDIRASSFVGRL